MTETDDDGNACGLRRVRVRQTWRSQTPGAAPSRQAPTVVTVAGVTRRLRGPPGSLPVGR